MRYILVLKPIIRKLWRRYRCYFVLILVVICFIWKTSGFSEVNKTHKGFKISTSKNRIVFRTSGNMNCVNDRVCVQPVLQLYHPSVDKFFYNVDPLRCNNDKNWVLVHNGTLYISEEAQKVHGQISCQYSPIYRKLGDSEYESGKPVKMSKNFVQMPTDFIKVFCVAKDGNRYFNIHAGIAYNKTIHKRTDKHKTNRGMGVSVLMFGFDSVSRLTWMRKLPKTHHYFTNVLDGIVLEGYNIVGDGTPQALLPILTGRSETELPESRRGKPESESVDRYPWIWKNYKNSGYVTQWTEDMAHIGTFNYRMKGFVHQPVDHYMRPFYLSAEKMYPFNRPYCLGSTQRHNVLIDWLRDSFKMYGSKKKFIFGFHSEYSHENSNNLQWADGDLFNFLKYLQESGHLNNTILILMSDHGARFHAIRETLQGKIEERMPYFAFRFPTWFKHKYPEAFNNFMMNSKTLSTPFDIHETIKDMLYYTKSRKGRLYDRGISLFNEIPKNRECSHAQIATHWCACLHSSNVKLSSRVTQTAAKEAITFINSLTLPHRDNCLELSINRIIKNQIFKLNKNLTMYRGSKDEDGRVVDLNASSSKDITENKVYQITMVTKPGDGKFEMTYLYNRDVGSFIFNVDEISRINRYGNSSHCISKSYPHLRQYCYCRKQV